MTAVFFVCAGLLGVSPPDRSDYQAAVPRAGKDAGAHVKLAVWCEAHGMDAERLKHLAVALASDPQNAAARAMMGLVEYGGKWLLPEKVGEAVKADHTLAAKRAQYEAKRQETPLTAEGQWQLALWCEKNGLKPEAIAHFSAVTQIAPRRAEAWRKLGCQLYHGRWLNAEQIAAERADAEAQKKADRHWQPKLEKSKTERVFDNPDREQAVAAVSKIADSRAVPLILRAFGHGNRAQHEVAVQILSWIDCPASSHALGAVSLFDRWPEVRKVAIDELKRRDPLDFMDAMIALMRHPLKVHLTPVGPSGEPGKLVVDGDRARTERVYQVPEIVAPVPGGPGYVATGTNGTTISIGPTSPLQIEQFLRENPDIQLGQTASYDEQAAHLVRYAQTSTRQTLQRDIQALLQFNARLARANQIVGCTLEQITGESLGADPDAWLTWWNDKLGLRYERIEPTYKKTTVQLVPIFVPVFQVHQSCFAAGTPSRP